MRVLRRAHYWDRAVRLFIVLLPFLRHRRSKRVSFRYHARVSRARPSAHTDTVVIMGTQYPTTVQRDHVFPSVSTTVRTIMLLSGRDCDLLLADVSFAIFDSCMCCRATVHARYEQNAYRVHRAHRYFSLSGSIGNTLVKRIDKEKWKIERNKNSRNWLCNNLKRNRGRDSRGGQCVRTP